VLSKEIMIAVMVLTLVLKGKLKPRQKDIELHAISTLLELQRWVTIILSKRET